MTASEVLISDYLSSLSTSDEVQPFCREVARTHWKDELSHAKIFTLIAEKIFKELDGIKRDYFQTMIVEASCWLCDKELEIWEAILLSVKIPNATKIITDIREEVIRREIHSNRLTKNRISTLIDHLQYSA